MHQIVYNKFSIVDIPFHKVCQLLQETTVLLRHDIYLFFLIALGMPVMVMELSLGRASRRNIFGAYKTLASDKRFKWHYPGAVFFLGNIILRMFYTTVTGWMIAYALKFAAGSLSGLDAEGVGLHFNNFLANPVAMAGFMLFTVAGSTAVCAIGLQKGVERITKFLMASLFLLLIGLCLRALFLPGAAESFVRWRSVIFRVPELSGQKVAHVVPPRFVRGSRGFRLRRGSSLCTMRLVRSPRPDCWFVWLRRRGAAAEQFPGSR